MRSSGTVDMYALVSDQREWEAPEEMCLGGAQSYNFATRYLSAKVRCIYLFSSSFFLSVCLFETVFFGR